MSRRSPVSRNAQLFRKETFSIELDYFKTSHNVGSALKLARERFWLSQQHEGVWQDDVVSRSKERQNEMVTRR